MTVWLEFIVSAAIIVIAATKLAEYGDAIAMRTGLGGMFSARCSSRERPPYQRF